MHAKFILVATSAVAIIAGWQYACWSTPGAAQLTEQGMPTAATAVASVNPMRLSEIEALKLLQRVSRPANRFWHRDASREASRIEQILDAEAKARAELIDHFGPQVTRVPALWQLFRPLHTRMPDLTSQEQIAIHTMERRYAADLLRSNGTASFEKHTARIAELLGADAASEYALHMSPLAEELRRLSIEFSEQTFREAFTALLQLSSPPSSESFVAARDQLRKLLGNLHFARLWSQRDPHFRRFETVGIRYGLTENAVLGAYALLLENQDAMLDIAVMPETPDQQQLLRDQHERGRRRMAELVGPEATDALLLAAVPDE